MLHEKRNTTLKTWVIVGGLVGLWLFLVWGMPAAHLHASSMTPALLTFQSPIGNPALTISKEITPLAPRPGQTLIYTVRYANTEAGSQAFNVRLYDFLPAGIEVISTYPAYDSYVDGAMIFEAPTIGPGTEPVTITIYARVREGFEELYNQALVTADGVTPTHASVHTLVTPPVRELAFTKTGYAVVLKDEALVYRLRCENTGEAPIENITVVDVLPADVILQEATPAPVETLLPLLRWTVGTLDVGEVWTAAVTTTAPYTVGVITNTALVAGDKIPAATRLFTTRVISEGAILDLTKTGAPAQVYLQETVVYTLEYTNRGNKPAHGVLLTDTLPVDVVMTGTTPTTTTLLSNSRVVWAISVITPAESGLAVITATVQGEAGRTLLNRAEIAAPGPDVFGSQAQFEIEVIFHKLYLPVVVRNYHP